MTSLRIFIFTLFLYFFLFNLAGAEPFCGNNRDQPPLVRLDETTELCQCAMEPNKATERVLGGDVVDRDYFSYIGLMYVRIIFDDVERNASHYDDFDYWYKTRCTVTVINFFNLIRKVSL